MSYCDRPVAKVQNTEAKEEILINQENIKEEKNMILVGKQAPSFTAPAYHKGEFKEINLEDYRGQWVMLCFYPGDFTFVCGTEVSTVAAKNKEFEDLGVQVISVSVDSQFVHKIWNDNELSKIAGMDIPFPMIADSSGAIGELYGVYDSEAGVDVRGRFIIDPEGIIQGMEILTPPVGRNVEEAIRQIKAYQYVREAKGTEVTPAGWQPGAKTLKPGPELVGNVWKTWTVDELGK
ncbi:MULTISPECIES: thioredoxin-dependent peroxiredoxin [Peptoniphilus]|nr:MULTISPECIES: thioredoxin-dependent peroxiredoxin [Peptoniphilus]